MIQSELAYNVKGEPFSVPETVTGWLAKLLRGGRGAPGVAYGRDGRPLTLGIEAGADDLRDAVDVSGRYRLDPIDDDGRVVEGVPAAYVQVTVPERNAATADVSPPTGLTSVDHALREIVRANLELARCNTELAKTVVSRQPDVMRSTAEILRAADGAGLPRREPSGWGGGEEDYDEDDDGDGADSGEPSGSTLDTIMSQLTPLIQIGSAYLGQKLGAPAPAPATRQTTRTASGDATSSSPTGGATACDDEDATTEPTPDRAPVADIGAHVMAIQTHLTADERRFVEGALTRLTLSELGQWQQQLARMSVAEAIAAIRAEIAKSAKPIKTKSTATPAAKNQEKVS